MVGFGPEDNHFVMELTYNYGVGEYKLGNDYQVRYRIMSLSLRRYQVNSIDQKLC